MWKVTSSYKIFVRKSQGKKRRWVIILNYILEKSGCGGGIWIKLDENNAK
jgi:hypothetical protein